MTQAPNFQGIHNFRDYGGYSAAGGKVRRGVLYRSGQHVAATDEDLAELAALDIRTVIDLRGIAERECPPTLVRSVVSGDDDGSRAKTAPMTSGGTSSNGEVFRARSSTFCRSSSSSRVLNPLPTLPTYRSLVPSGMPTRWTGTSRVIFSSARTS